MELITFKYICAGAILLTTLLGPLLSIRLTASKWTSRLESLAGGVFLGAGFGHLLADSFEELNGITKYPLAAAVTVVVFSILALIQLFTSSEEEYEDLDSPSCSSSQREKSEGGAPVFRSPGGGRARLGASIIVLYIIMDAHSVVEGVALGILPKWSNAIAIFCAIIGHKPVEAFSLGLMVLKGHPTKFVYTAMMIIYSLLTPIGILGAIFLSKVSSKLVIGLIAAFSSGTFIYVGFSQFCELMSHKKEWDSNEKVWQSSMFVAGIVWMLLIAIVETLE